MKMLQFEISKNRLQILIFTTLTS